VRGVDTDTPPKMLVQLLVLERARAIAVERVEREVVVGLVSDDAELLQRAPKLALLNLARAILVKLAESVDDPVQVLGERHLELADDAGDARLLVWRELERCRLGGSCESSALS
jgi:hypothetical protein